MVVQSLKQLQFTASSALRCVLDSLLACAPRCLAAGQAAAAKLADRLGALLPASAAAGAAVAEPGAAGASAAEGALLLARLAAALGTDTPALQVSHSDASARN